MRNGCAGVARRLTGFDTYRLAGSPSRLALVIGLTPSVSGRPLFAASGEPPDQRESADRAQQKAK